MTTDFAGCVWPDFLSKDAIKICYYNRCHPRLRKIFNLPLCLSLSLSTSVHGT